MNYERKAMTQTVLYNCKICQKLFAGLGKLNTHQRIHEKMEKSVTNKKRLVKKSKNILKMASRLVSANFSQKIISRREFSKLVSTIVSFCYPYSPRCAAGACV